MRRVRDSPSLYAYYMKQLQECERKALRSDINSYLDLIKEIIEDNELDNNDKLKILLPIISSILRIYKTKNRVEREDFKL